MSGKSSQPIYRVKATDTLYTVKDGQWVPIHVDEVETAADLPDPEEVDGEWR